MTGQTYSADFPTENPVQASHGGNGDAFVTKLNASGNALVYSTYLGGDNWDYGYGIAADSSGNTYVTGGVESTNFPMASAVGDFYYILDDGIAVHSGPMEGLVQDEELKSRYLGISKAEENTSNKKE